MEKAVQRWMVDVSEWNPSSEAFSSAISTLPPHERPSITRFRKMEDRKRALVSRLLQYALVHQLLEVPYDQVLIKRTSEGKPYVDSDKLQTMKFPNFNFNVSHHGEFVAIASEPLCLVGLDIVSATPPSLRGTSDFVHNFSSYFSNEEWDRITSAGTSDQILVEFYRFWSLKEAFVKAIGSGVGYRLNQVEFHHTGWTNIAVSVDGKELREWRFWHFELRNRHFVSIARGCPRMATVSYKKALRQINFSEDEYESGFCLPNVGFTRRTVEELIYDDRPRFSSMEGIPCTHLATWSVS